MTSPIAATHAEQLLREAGLRVTRPRLAVVDALRAHPHAGADTVLGVVRRELGAVSTQGVYDVLRVLTERGVTRRIQPAGSVARYELRSGDNHHHLVCRGCGTVDDVDCALGQAPCLEPDDARGFVIDQAEVTYWGLCRACAPASRDAAPATSSTPVPHAQMKGDTHE